MGGTNSLKGKKKKITKREDPNAHLREMTVKMGKLETRCAMHNTGQVLTNISKK